VANVTKNGPAEAAGILAGDVILSFNGRAIDKMRALPRIVAETPVGKKSDVVVWRKGKEKTVAVTLGRLEAQEAATASAAKSDEPAKASGIDAMGLSITALNETLRTQFEIPEDITGVVVTEVKEVGNAAKKGLRPGDIIQEVNQEAVAAPGDVAQVVAEAIDAGRKSVLVLFNRGGERRFIVVPVTDEK
jgi:serine protease Do